jgi:hypothetical protein
VARTETVPRGRSTVFLRRADEFYAQMERAAKDGAWNAVGLLGMHCIISACDALTVRLSGQRWSGQDHAGVVDMVNALGIPDADRASRQVSRVLGSKNRVEYESREFTEAEGREVREGVGRVLRWVKSNLASKS